jgi:hypothetical protein
MMQNFLMYFLSGSILRWMPRILCGIGMGMDGTVHPVYVCELTSTSFRGGVCTASQISIKIGIASKKEGNGKK